jgi:hypothetical protein
LVGGTGQRATFTNSQASVKVGTGSKGVLTFPPMQNISFNMNFTVLYRPDPSVQLKDDVLLNEILQSCNVIYPGNRTMKVHYKALCPIASLKPIGITPVFEDDVNVSLLVLFFRQRLTTDQLPLPAFLPKHPGLWSFCPRRHVKSCYIIHTGSKLALIKYFCL